MKKEQDYIRDIAQIRSMMERSSKFLSLSGWAGIMAGVYALSGAFIAIKVFRFNPGEIGYSLAAPGNFPEYFQQIILVALIMLVLAIGTAIFLSSKKADSRGERAWNATSRQMLTHMAVPLVAGGLLILVLLFKGLIGVIAPLTLIFYGIALYNASKFTFDDVKFLGLTQIGLGLISAIYIEYSLLFWAAGFGLAHIVYGIYVHLRYER